MPELLRDLITFINRWPGQPSNVWKRFRIAVTEEEMKQLRTFFAFDNKFIWAVRGVPLVLEDHPTSPLYRLETFEGITQDEHR